MEVTLQQISTFIVVSALAKSAFLEQIDSVFPGWHSIEVRNEPEINCEAPVQNFIVSFDEDNEETKWVAVSDDEITCSRLLTDDDVNDDNDEEDEQPEAGTFAEMNDRFWNDEYDAQQLCCVVSEFYSQGYYNLGVTIIKRDQVEAAHDNAAFKNIEYFIEGNNDAVKSVIQ